MTTYIIVLIYLTVIAIVFLWLNNSMKKEQERVKYYERRLSLMNRISSTLCSTLNLDEILELIVKTTVEETGAIVCSLRLYNTQTKELVLKASCGEKDSVLYKNPIALGDGIVGKVFQTKKHVAVSNFLIDSSLMDPEMPKRGGFQSMLSVPIMAREEAIGVLTVYHNEQKEFNGEDIQLLYAIAAEAAVTIENATLFDRIKNMYISTIKSIAAALSARDAYTRGHSDESSRYARAIAEELSLNSHQKELLEYGSILHDIGKIGISDDILNKPSKLSKGEYEVMKRHPIIGAKIIEPLEEFKELAYIIAHHHEHYNGTGYPDGLSQEEIPLIARILHVVDAFHAMTSDRPYRKALAVGIAIDELQKGSGSQFDPVVVDALIRIIEKKKI